MSVDSALATKTKTSASKQNWSIHVSRSGLMSIPGLKKIKVLLYHVKEEKSNTGGMTVISPVGEPVDKNDVIFQQWASFFGPADFDDSVGF